MMMSGRKSLMSCTCRSVMPPETGITAQPEPLGAVVRAEAAGEQAVAVGDVDLGRPAAGGADRRAPSRPTRCRCRAACSRRPSACRWCRTRRECARSCPAARRTCRRDSCRAGRCFVVKGNLARSSSRLRSSGCTPAVVELLPVVRHVLVGVAQRPLQPLGCSAASSSRELAFSMGSSWSCGRHRMPPPVERCSPGR